MGGSGLPARPRGAGGSARGRARRGGPALTRCALVLLCVLGLAACGGTDETASTPAAPKPAAKREPRPKPAHCPANAANCRAAAGRILYVEKVDPDGDGDAHFVLTSRDAVTLPGISVIDVEKEMRPEPLPGPGDLVSAAGPVYRGSYGQRQIQATQLHVARR